MTESELVPVLVTGSRDFRDRVLVRQVLVAVQGELGVPSGEIVIVHGAQGTVGRDARVVKGLDLLAAEAATGLGMLTDPHPAVWDVCGPRCRPAHRRSKRGGGTYCPTAGFRRNQKMVDVHGPEYYCCLGFPLGPSHGTRDCMRRAATAGIRVVNCTETVNPR